MGHDVNTRVLEVFEYLVKNKKINNKALFSRHLGTLPQTLNNILAKKQRFTLNHISNLLIHYPYINAEWILTGKGSMLKEAPASTAPEKEKDELLARLKDKDELLASKDEIIELLKYKLQVLEKRVAELEQRHNAPITGVPKKEKQL